MKRRCRDLAFEPDVLVVSAVVSAVSAATFFRYGVALMVLMGAVSFAILTPLFSLIDEDIEEE